MSQDKIGFIVQACAVAPNAAAASHWPWHLIVTPSSFYSRVRMRSPWSMDLASCTPFIELGWKYAKYSSWVLCAVNVGSTVFAIVTVDKLGRRALLIYGGIVMIMCEIITGVCLGYFFNHDHGVLTSRVSDGILAVICIYVAHFAISWGEHCWFFSPVELATQTFWH